MAYTDSIGSVDEISASSAPRTQSTSAVGFAADAGLDPAVKAAVDQTIAAAKSDSSAASGKIIQSLATQNKGQSTFTPQQRADYVAAVINHLASDTQMTDVQRRNLAQAIDSVGTIPADEKLQIKKNMQTAIAEGVKSGKISDDQIYAIVDPKNVPYAEGSRSLLAELPGSVLSNISIRLQNKAMADYEGTKSTTLQNARIDQNGNASPVALAGASMATAMDIANMAAAKGATAAANQAVTTLDANTTKMEAEAKLGAAPRMSLLNAVTWSSDPNFRYANYNNSAPQAFSQSEKSGFQVVSTLLNSAKLAPQSGGNATDRLFAKLLYAEKIGTAEYVYKGSKDKSATLSEMSKYFENNQIRLVDLQLRANQPEKSPGKTSDIYQSIAVDFTRHVVLDKDFTRTKEFAQSSRQLVDYYATIVESPNVEKSIRDDAAAKMGLLMGSIQHAGADYALDVERGAEKTAGLFKGLADGFFRFTGQKLSMMPGWTKPVGMAIKAGGPRLTAMFSKQYVESKAAGAEKFSEKQLADLFDVNMKTDVIADKYYAEMSANMTEQQKAELTKILEIFTNALGNYAKFTPAEAKGKD